MNLIMCMMLITFIYSKSIHFDTRLNKRLEKPTVRYYEFNVTEGIIAPDGYSKPAILINNQFPGPEIICNIYDTLQIKVNNLLQNQNFSLHFHGIDQKNSINSDGVPYVTQYPIFPNKSFMYTFSVRDQSGTYWYHAHTMLHDDTAFGALIVKDDIETLESLVEYNKEYNYEEERLLILSDNYHLNTNKQLDNIIYNNNFTTLGDPQSILLNGQGKLLRTQISQSPYSDLNTQSKYRAGYNVIEVEQNKKYRLRLICASTYSFLSFEISNHEFVVIEVDGIFVEPYKTNRIDINSGQRYSVILNANQNINTYWTKASVIFKDDPNNGFGLLNYKNSPNINYALNAIDPNSNGVSVNTNAIIGRENNNRWIIDSLDLSNWYATSNYYKNNSNDRHVYTLDDEKVTKNFFFNFTEQRKGNRTNFLVNEVVYQDPQIPILDSLVSSNNYNNNGIYEIEQGDTVQIVLQNMATIEGECLQHPWHLHGHSFYVIANGDGLYNNNNIKPYKNPILRDTTTLYPSLNSNNTSNKNAFLPNEPCGWQVIKFKANNPGAWLFHCHITEHMLMGMRLVFIEKPKGKEQYKVTNTYSSSSDSTIKQFGMRLNTWTLLISFYLISCIGNSI